MDQDAFYLINHFWARPWLDVAMAAASSWDLWWPFLIVGGLAVLGFGGFHARVMVLVAGIAVGVTDGIVVDSLKHIVGRPRPHEVLVGARTLDLAKARPWLLTLDLAKVRPWFLAPGQPLKGDDQAIEIEVAPPRFLALGRPLKERYSHPENPPARGNSFPSGHASNNFALATVVMLFYRRWGWLAFVPAALVSYSRIYVGSHWPMDVLVSCFLGAGIAFLVASGLESCWRRWGAKMLPALHAAHPSLIKP